MLQRDQRVCKKEVVPHGDWHGEVLSARLARKGRLMLRGMPFIQTADVMDD